MTPPKLPPNTTAWSIAEVARLKALYAADASFSVIAAEFNRSRSSISGMTRRLGLAKRQVRNAAKASPKPRPVIVPKRTPVPPRPMRPIAPSLHPVPLLDAQPAHCRAILDQRDARGGVLFCGDPKQPDSSYCPTHHQRFHRDSARPED